MRAIDADALQLAIVEEGQANKRKKYIIGDIWELTGAEIRDVINSQPTIQPEPHWIQVTKDTPKEAGTYMCTCYDAGRRIVTLAKWQPRTKTWNLTGARAYWKVIAWCKCPEPFKGVTT